MFFPLIFPLVLLPSLFLLYFCLSTHRYNICCCQAFWFLSPDESSAANQSNDWSQTTAGLWWPELSTVEKSLLKDSSEAPLCPKIATAALQKTHADNLWWRIIGGQPKHCRFYSSIREGKLLRKRKTTIQSFQSVAKPVVCIDLYQCCC